MTLLGIFSDLGQRCFIKVQERGQIAKGGGLQLLESIEMEPGSQVFCVFCRFLGRGGERVLCAEFLWPVLS